MSEQLPLVAPDNAHADTYIGRRCVFSALVGRVNDWGLGPGDAYIMTQFVRR